MAKKFILSIDGGGILGLIPAIVLVELEKRLRAAGVTSPFYKLFDLIAGTSTGGIIAAGLSCPHPGDGARPACTPLDLVALYEREGGAIFPYDRGTRWLSTLTNPMGLVGPKFSATPLEERLKARLGTRRLSEALTLTVLTAYDIERRCAVFMGNAKGSAARAPDDYLFWQAARATSAAPTYFAPAAIDNLSTAKREALVDGGVFANDPAMAAVVEAKKQGWADDDLVIVSLGTGMQNRPFPYEKAKDWGAGAWINPQRGSPIISILMQAQASTVSYQLAKLYGDKPETCYYRFDTELTTASDDMDDATPENLAKLRAEAEGLIRQQSAMLDAVVARLKGRV